MRFALSVGFVVCWIGIPSVRSQVTDPAEIPAPDDQLALLERCREGLVDPEARSVERRRWAETLLSLGTAEAGSMVIELLGPSTGPEVQRALCAVIADRARRSPEELDHGLVAPLIDRLGAEAEDIRAMAAQALSDFSGSEVPAALGALAAQKDVPVPKRLAAVNALTPNTHRREVVAQLIRLLDADVPEVAERVMAALEPVFPQTFGRDVVQWRAWWEAESHLSEDAWLSRQLRIHRDRWRQAEDRLQMQREIERLLREALSSRIGGFQREIYRSLSPDDRPGKLAEWLGDPIAQVHGTALAIIKARIADEGKRPEGEVLAAVLALLEKGSPVIRRDVLEIAQNLSDPAVVEAILAQLQREEDTATRCAIFVALGKLDHPAAVPAMVHEIAEPQSKLACVREAAMALGNVAAHGSRSSDQAATVEVLANRYATVPLDQVSLRVALLTAMAGVADASFAETFYSAVESDDSTVLREAIRGLRAIGDVSRLPRLRTLVAHSDPFVRVEAIETLGRFGREEADLERLLMRLRPADEPNERARDAAWRGFLAFAARRSIEEQVAMAQRLSDLPEIEAAYLLGLTESLATANGDTTQRETVLDRLGGVLLDLDRHADAIEHLQALWDLRRSRDAGEAFPIGLRLLSAKLTSHHASRLSELVRQLVESSREPAGKGQVVELIAAYVDAPHAPAAAERVRAVLAELQALPDGVLGETSRESLERVQARMESASTEAPSPGP